MDTLKDQYRLETNKDVYPPRSSISYYAGDSESFTDDYIKWLENKVKELSDRLGIAGKSKTMNSPKKTEECNKFCVGCEEYTDEYHDDNSGHDKLCKGCDEKYENQTGHCSLSCCLGYGCDETC